MKDGKLNTGCDSIGGGPGGRQVTALITPRIHANVFNTISLTEMNSESHL